MSQERQASDSASSNQTDPQLVETMTEITTKMKRHKAIMLIRFVLSLIPFLELLNIERISYNTTFSDIIYFLRQFRDGSQIRAFFNNWNNGTVRSYGITSTYRQSLYFAIFWVYDTIHELKNMNDLNSIYEKFRHFSSCPLPNTPGDVKQEIFLHQLMAKANLPCEKTVPIVEHFRIHLRFWLMKLSFSPEQIEVIYKFNEHYNVLSSLLFNGGYIICSDVFHIYSIIWAQYIRGHSEPDRPTDVILFEQIQIIIPKSIANLIARSQEKIEHMARVKCGLAQATQPNLPVHPGQPVNHVHPVQVIQTANQITKFKVPHATEVLLAIPIDRNIQSVPARVLNEHNSLDIFASIASSVNPLPVADSETELEE